MVSRKDKKKVRNTEFSHFFLPSRGYSGLARGREATERERAMILSCYRRTLSTTAARASSGCLLGRLAKVGESHRVAAKRRAWAKREGERLEEERRAHWRAHVQGKGVMRGEFVYTV